MPFLMKILSMTMPVSLVQYPVVQFMMTRVSERLTSRILLLTQF